MLINGRVQYTVDIDVDKENSIITVGIDVDKYISIILQSI